MSAPSHGGTTPNRRGSLNNSSTVLSRSLTSISTLGSPSTLLHDDSPQLSMSSSHLNTTADSSLLLDDHHGNHSLNDKEGEMETAKGGYLGRFTTDRRGKGKYYDRYMCTCTCPYISTCMYICNIVYILLFIKKLMETSIPGSDGC